MPQPMIVTALDKAETAREAIEELISALHVAQCRNEILLEKVRQLEERLRAYEAARMSMIHAL